MRAYIVWFGEEVRYIEEARQLVEQAEIFVVIGTSLVVYPAAGLVSYARKDIPKFLVDPSDMEDHLPYGFKHIKAKATEGVDILMEEIKKKENSILPF
jgi:NAD-dependent deacetylase